MAEINKILELLPDKLPRIAEEGPFLTTVSSRELIDIVAENLSINQYFVEGVVMMLQQDWDAMGLLDSTKLREGSWQFTSYPASLIARSLLDSLAKPRPQFFESGWWHNESYIEQQRNLLIEVENRRIHFHKEHRPDPVRQVQVAWALIKIENNLLFNHREDRERKANPNHVLIGGRLNLHDLEKAFPESTVEERLVWQQTSDTNYILQALPHTLSRELNEELGLLSQHYQAELHQTLNGYDKLEGARANHAYTRYQIYCFTVQLTQTGFQQLCRRQIELPKGQLVWANSDEILIGKQGDRKFFVDAWRESAGKSFWQQLEDVPQSMATADLVDEQVDLPYGPESLLLYGRSGQEQSLEINLDGRQQSWLIGLAWLRLHQADFPLEEIPDWIQIHQLGWLELDETREIEREELNKLAEIFRNAGLPIVEGSDAGWFRMSVSKDHLYFAETFFTLRPYHESDKYELHLLVPDLKTPIGELPDCYLSIRGITPTVYRDMVKVLKGFPTDELGDPKRSFREQLTKQAQPLGLRIPIRNDGFSFYTQCETI